MRRLIRLLGCLAALGLSACANLQSVSAFADQTTALTGALREEFQQIDALCTEQAELRIVVTNEPDDALLDSCRLQGDALVAFQEVTVDTIDLYAQALLLMVDDGRFDLRSPIETASQKVAALKTRSGGAVISADKIGSLNKVLALLADVVARRKRDEGVRRLVAAGPDLVAQATVLREFFAGRGGSSPYDRWIQVVDRFATSSAVQLAPGTPLARQEPLRAAELRRAVERTRPAIAQRSGDASPSVPRTLVAALDEWIAAVPVFQQEALRSDAAALRDRIEALRQKARDARQAVRSGV